MIRNTKDPSLKKDESATTGNRLAENDNPETSSHDTSENLNAGELAAFQKIMGDIDGQEEEESNGTPEETGTGEKVPQALTEDESAAPDQEIETSSGESPTGVDIPDSTQPATIDSEDGGDECLDEDQQRAFESIMGQIESGGRADADSRKETGDSSESEITDDSPAESEKRIQETIPAEVDEVQEAESTESDDALTGDQQHAVESIMAQIEVDDTEPTEENSQNIDDILTEIAISDDESHRPEAASDDSDSKPATVEAPEKSMLNDDIVVHKKTDGGLEQTDPAPTPTPSGNNRKTIEPDESPPVKGPSGDPESAKKPMPARLIDRQRPEPLREATNPAVGRSKKAILASLVAILFLALAGFFYGIPENMVASAPFPPDTDTSRRDTVVDVQASLQVHKPVDVVHDESDLSRLKAAAENLDRLRNELIDKQAEIGELRAYYQAGIDAEFQRIADRVRSAGKGTIPFESAMADPSISLGLSAIQRRDFYVKKLETPVNILVGSSEELLFFSRKAALLALMAGKTSDIDIDGFIKQADEVRKVHGSGLAQLDIDAVPATPRALETIWQDIEKRRPTTTVNAENDNRITDTDNTTIWKNICGGDFSQKHQMTKLSPSAARCLTTWKGKDLFLNALTDLSPDAARHLSAWEGDWLGLNGLRELSPETAVYLSRWKGRGLSLNSLSRLSPRVVAILSDWQGDQIELINVKHMADWKNPNTRLFLSEDLKRKLSATRK